MRFLVLALLATACGAPAPDPRQALLAAPEGALRDAAAEGAAMWDEATAGDVALTLVDRCPSGPAYCITVAPAAEIDGGDACGATARWEGSDGTAGAFVTVTRDGVTAVTLAHEIGHALGLGHVDGSGEVMFEAASAPAVIGPETLAAYHREYE